MPTLSPPAYPLRPEAPLLSFGPSFGEEISRSTIAAVWRSDDDQPQETDVRVAAALTMLEAFHPRDHLECMMAAQGVACHTAIMDAFSRAMRAEVAELAAIKSRANATQLGRMFSLLVHDMERRQAKPLPDYMSAPPEGPGEGPKGGTGEGEPDTPPDPAPPSNPPPVDAAPNDAPPVDAPPGPRKRATRPRATKAAATPAPVTPIQVVAAPVVSPIDETTALAEPEDPRIRPDGTPGTLAGYLPKPAEESFVPWEIPVMRALALRPKPWRMVNTPPGETSPEAAPPDTDPWLLSMPDGGSPDLGAGLLAGDALARFASTRLDPNAPHGPPLFDDEYSEVELELISTGGDPDAERERAALMEAHPEGRAALSIQHGHARRDPSGAEDDEAANPGVADTGGGLV